MKRVEIKGLMHENTNDRLVAVLSSVPEIHFVSKLDEALEKRGLTQGKLATLTGLRPSTISEIAKCNRIAITKTHIATIMIALRITDIRELIDIEFDISTFEKFEKESKSWIEDDVIPQDISNMYSEHAKDLFNPDIRG